MRTVRRTVMTQGLPPNPQQNEIDAALQREEVQMAETLRSEEGEFLAKLKQLTPRVFMTPGLIAINVIIFVAMVTTGVSPFSPEIPDLLAWGASYGPQTTHGEWWRLLSNNYLHIGILHLALNMWVLWDVGGMVERMLGNLSMFVVYTICGLTGSFASLFWNPGIVSAGASGAVFGLCGAVLGILVAQRHSIPPSVVKQKQTALIAFIGYNVVFGLTQSNVDNAAHFGGLAAGFILGLIVRMPSREQRAKRLLATLAAGAVLLAGGFMLNRGGIDDVKTALEEFGKTEKVVLERLTDMQKRIAEGTLSDEQFAVELNRDILVPWHAARLKFDTAKVPEHQLTFKQQFSKYMLLREQGWQILADPATANDPAKLELAEQKAAEADKVIQEFK